MNSSFSTLRPSLQLAIDSTSLGAFKTCPRYYQLSIVEGFVSKGENVHLRFGLLLHEAREVYDGARLKGEDHESALDGALDMALKATWDAATGRAWASGHLKKNRLSLLRAIVWYLDSKGKDDNLETLVRANGRPAVELSFHFDSGYRTKDGEPWLLCGHIDRLARLNTEVMPVDIKTTTHQLNREWFEQFSPHNQFTIYLLATRVAFEVPARALIVDGVEVGATFVRCERGIVERTEAQLQEWLGEVEVWLRHIEEAAEAAKWPMNETSCDKYGGCPYRTVCAASPAARAHRLEHDFTRRVWDPLRARGDI